MTNCRWSKAKGRAPEERFWEKVDRGAPDACWPWLATLVGAAPWRYGNIYWGDRTEKAHRVSWVLAFGEIPAGLHVLHRCDNPPCVNPAHLFLGTDADNVADMIAKGRKAPPIRGAASGPARHPERMPRGNRHGSRLHPELIARGERVGTSKLRAADVRAIRASAETCAVLGARYGITPSSVSHIRTRRTWCHLEPPTPTNTPTCATSAPADEAP